MAPETAVRIPPAAPITQSRRVWPTISMIVGTPRPGSPSMRPQAPLNSTSDDALDLLPSLSLRRCSWKPSFLVPSGKKRGTAKHERPSSVWASTRNRSLIGALQNHLWPTSAYSAPAPPPLSAVAVVLLARTSEPPLLGHRHAADRARLLGGGLQRAVVAGGRQARHPLGGDLGRRAQCRHRGEGHGDGTAEAGLGLRAA